MLRTAIRAPAVALVLAVGAPNAGAEKPGASLSSEVTAERVKVELESPTLPGWRSLPTGDIPASLHDEQLARWNLGGTGDASYPSNQPRFHPAVRVIVDAAVAGAWGRRGSVDALRRKVEARSRSTGYWPFRLCFEQALRSSAPASVDYRLRLTATAVGRVTAVRGLVDLEDTALQDCLEQGASSLDLGSLPARRVDAELRIRLWPGDTELPSRKPPDPDCPDPAQLASTLRHAAELWRSSRSSLVRCTLTAAEQDSGLWGRIALWAEFGPDGSTTALREFESHFPDADVTGCVKRVVRAFRMPGAPRSPLVFALRIGELPTMGDSAK